MTDKIIEVTISKDKKAYFKFNTKELDFYSPISTTLHLHPKMWFSNTTQNDLGVNIYLKGNQNEINADALEFITYYYEHQLKYKQNAIQALVNFSNIDWNTGNYKTVLEDWGLLSILYYGKEIGVQKSYHFGMAFYPNEKKWIDTYCQWFVTFYHSKLIGINRTQW